MSQTFTGHLRYNSVDVKASGPPSGKVPAGKPVTVSVKVHNNGAAPALYFADPCLVSEVDIPLALQQGDATIALPFPATAGDRREGHEGRRCAVHRHRVRRAVLG